MSADGLYQADRLPSVTCVMPTFNYARYIGDALHSVLAQDYPPELLDVVVVDDGSTDDSAQVVAGIQATMPGRVRLIRQANRGVTAATAVALRHADGELIAMCDPDDLWLPGRIRGPVEIFQTRPEVALVYGDMQIIDAGAKLIKPSLFADQGLEFQEGEVLEALVEQNFAPNSTLTLRASSVIPYPPRMPLQDYWLVVNAAAVGQTVAIHWPLASYRLHGDNMEHGTDGTAFVATLERELLGRRLIINEMAERIAAPALQTLVWNLLAKARWTATLSERSLEQIFAITDDERALSVAEVGRGQGMRAHDDRLRAFTRAVVLDPFNTHAQELLLGMAAQSATVGSRASNPRATRALVSQPMADGPAFTVPRQSSGLASVIIPAFNRAAYLEAAIESALEQNLPGKVEVIIVDDGSTDETPAVLSRFGERVRSVRQPNSGLVAAVNRGLGLVHGEFIGLLDADDLWPPDRLGRHIQALRADPTLGLVHGDMNIIDADGVEIHPSFFERERKQVPVGRVLGPLLAGNFVSGGASTFRASLLPAVYPITADAAYPDWWLAACIAAVANVGLAPGIANHYRQHASNMGLGSGVEAQPRIQRAELPWRRWMLSNLINDDTITVAHLREAFTSLQFGLLLAAATENRGAHALAHIFGVADATPDELPPVQVGGRRSRALLRALAANPFDGATAIDLELALRQESRLQALAPAPPLIELQSGPELVLGWVDEVVTHPNLLRAFGSSTPSQGDATLVLLARRESDLNRLRILVDADARLSDPGCDITVIAEPATTPARRLLVARATSLLSRTTVPADYAQLPRHSAVEPPASEADDA